MTHALKDLANIARRGAFFLNVPRTLRMLRFKALRKRFYGELWQAAADNIGADYEAWPHGYALISKNGRSTLVRHGEVMLDSHLTLQVMGNKALVYKLMAEKGLAAPRHCVYRTGSFAKAAAFLREASGPVVVKPASGTGGGRGVTTGIRDTGALRRASRLAAAFGGELIVEEQLEGRSYRLLYLNGKLIDAVRRDPPVVTGDGAHTVKQLIERENQRRLAAPPYCSLSPLVIDQDARHWLAERGLSLAARPEAGTRVQVKRAVNENARAQQHGVLDKVHPETAAAGARLARDLGVMFAGVDVHCRDIAKPLDAANGLITEINTTPGIHHHYLVRDPGRAAPVAEQVLSFMFQTGHGTLRLSADTADTDTAGTDTADTSLPKREKAIAEPGA